MLYDLGKKLINLRNVAYVESYETDPESDEFPFHLRFVFLGVATTSPCVPSGRDHPLEPPPKPMIETRGQSLDWGWKRRAERDRVYADIAQRMSGVISSGPCSLA
jgi:hypothetical protein